MKNDIMKTKISSKNIDKLCSFGYAYLRQFLGSFIPFNYRRLVFTMVFEKVREILCDQLDIDEDEVTLESNIVDDFGADSLDLVDFIMSLEEEFDKEIPDEDVEKIKTVGDVVSYIENSL